MEIDEYSDYAKARDAMDMALKYLTKDTSRAATDMAASIEHRMMLIKKFLSAREAAKSDPSTMVAICAALLQEVRDVCSVDVFAVVIFLRICCLFCTCLVVYYTVAHSPITTNTTL